MQFKEYEKLGEKFQEQIVKNKQFKELMSAYTLNQRLTGISDEILLKEIQNLLEIKFKAFLKKKGHYDG